MDEKVVMLCKGHWVTFYRSFLHLSFFYCQQIFFLQSNNKTNTFYKTLKIDIFTLTKHRTLCVKLLQFDAADNYENKKLFRSDVRAPWCLSSVSRCKYSILSHSFKVLRTLSVFSALTNVFCPGSKWSKILSSDPTRNFARTNVAHLLLLIWRHQEMFNGNITRWTRNENSSTFQRLFKWIT